MINNNHIRQCCSVFEGHADAISAVAFTHDSRYLVTACNEGTWRLFDTLDEKNGIEALMVCDASHDLGVQGCDFSPTAGSVVSSTCEKMFFFFFKSPLHSHILP